MVRSGMGAPMSFESALPGLIREVAPRLRGLALRLCRDEHDADDLVQEVFLQAQRRWSTFRGDAEPGTWMYAIAARLCRARHRRRFGGRDSRMPALSQVTRFAETTISRAGEQESPLRGAERREALEGVQAAILSMPETFRVPLVLTEVLELPVRQVAGALGLKEETVRTRVHRGRLLLRRAMLARVRQTPAPRPVYERRVCVDLLSAKLAALDEHREFAAADEVICRRCRAVFHELDLVSDACRQIARGEIPPALRATRRKMLTADGVKSGTRDRERASKKRPRAGAR